MRAIGLGVVMLCVAVSAQADQSSFRRIMAQGQPVECSFRKTDGSQEGTMRSAGQKFRGDFTVHQGRSGAPMHMISDSEKMYMWGGEMGPTQGMIMPVAPSGAASSGAHGPSGADMDEEMEFSCQAWSGDASAFDPPSDVQFMDMSQMMSNAFAAMGDSGN